MSTQTRRDFLRTTGIAIASVAASSLLPGCAGLEISQTGKGKKDDRPNILYVMTDDHASCAISCYGGRYADIVKTPNIDRIAREGIRFSNCFVLNSLCEPSRATILTGKYSHINGVITNAIKFDNRQQTFPKLLRKAGYQTAAIGKWHLKSDPTGFDYWKILPGQGVYYNPFMIEMGKLVKHEGYVTDVVTDSALDWLKNKRKAGKPFLLMYQHKAPHQNWKPSLRDLTLYDDVEMPVPENYFDDYSTRGRGIRNQWITLDKNILDEHFKLTPPYNLNEEQLKVWNKAYGPKNKAFHKAKLKGKELSLWKYQRFIKDYMRTNKAVDDNLGRVLDYLDESGLAENTIVVYTTDNGFFLGEHGLYDKRFMYEESIRIPLVVRYPKEIKPSQVNEDIVLNLDFAETFLDFAGVKIPKEMQGRSLRPLMNGRTPADWRKSMYYHFYEFPGMGAVKRQYGVRTERYKLIHLYYDNNDWEMYDLKKDPMEMNNVNDDPAYAKIRQELLAELKRLQKQYGDSDELIKEMVKKYPRGDLHGMIGNVLPPPPNPDYDTPH